MVINDQCYFTVIEIICNIAIWQFMMCVKVLKKIVFWYSYLSAFFIKCMKNDFNYTFKRVFLHVWKSEISMKIRIRGFPKNRFIPLSEVKLLVILGMESDVCVCVWEGGWKGRGGELRWYSAQENSVRTLITVLEVNSTAIRLSRETVPSDRRYHDRGAMARRLWTSDKSPRYSCYSRLLRVF